MQYPKNLQWDFGSFRLDGSRHLLFRNGQLVALPPKTAEVLVVLVERHGHLVEKEELMKAVWPDSFVEEANLAVHISHLRKTLGEENGPQYIETIPRRGYRFVGSVNGGAAAVTVPEPAPKILTEASPQTVWIPPNPRGPAPEASPASPGPSAGHGQPPARRLTLERSSLLAGAVLLLATAVVLGVRSTGRRIGATEAPANHPSAIVDSASEKDSVVLADIANNTGESVFDTTLRQGMAIELEQSPFLSLVPEERLQESLRHMGRAADTPLTPEVSLDLCQRTGSAAVIDGWIAKMGTQYVLGVRALNCRTGDHLADLETNAAGREQVLKALGDITRQLRAKLGESLNMLQRFDTPIEEATTPSLEALQAYSIGRTTMVQKGEDASCVPFFERAIRLDPDFAMAYAALGNAYSNLGEDGLAAQNIAKAYALREHVSQREKFYIESHYHQFVTGDLDKARHAYELWAKTYPRDVAPRTNLAVIDSDLGNFQQSLEWAKEAVRIAPDNSQNYANLVNAYISLDQPGEAKAVAEEAFQRNLDSPFLRLYLYDVAFLQHDAEGMRQQVAWSEGEPGVEDSFLDHQGSALAYVGQLAQARAFTDRASDAAVHAGEKETAAGYELNAAQREALFGNPAQARRRAEKALSLAGDRDTQYGAAVALALAGDTQRAAALADGLNRRFPEDTFVLFCYLPTIQGAIALQRKDATGALKELSSAAPYELGVAGGLLPVYLRGLAYLQSGDGSRAAIEFQKIVDHPGVVLNAPIGPLALLGLGRSYALAGQSVKAKRAYDDFLRMWQNADADIPVLVQARAEARRFEPQANQEIAGGKPGTR